MKALTRPGRLLPAALALAVAAGATACGASIGSRPHQTERTTPTPASSGSNPPGCVSGRAEISYQMGEPQPGQLCVRVGTELVITLHGPPGYKWTDVQSAEPAVVSVVTHATRGTATATGRALAPGHSELRSTVSFTGDPFGPPTRLWRQTIRVVP